MENTLANIPLHNNESEHRLEMAIDGHIAFVEYEVQDGHLDLTHTLVPEALGGKGVGKVLAEKVFRHLDETGTKAKVYCPFLLKYLFRNPQWEKVTI